MNFSGLETFGEPGCVVYLSDCVEFMRGMPDSCVDCVFADPPYRLSGGGMTVSSGEVVSVDKGDWDRTLGSFGEDHAFNVAWISEAKRILKPGGCLWVSGTHHIIFSLGYAIRNMDFRILSTVVWEKTDPPPNRSGTSFRHSHETLIWATKRGARHTFDGASVNGSVNVGRPDSGRPDSQLGTVWRIPHVTMEEKRYGRHPTQKPLRLLRRIILSTTKPGDLILDPFCGSGTTAVAAKELGRFFVGAEREREYAELAGRRIAATEAGSLAKLIQSNRRPE